MAEDFGGCVAWSVVAVGEGAAEWSESLGALSEGLSSKGTPSGGWCSSPGSSSSTPVSTAPFSFSLPSGATDSPLKATPKPSSETSPSPLKGTEGTSFSGSGSPGLGFLAGSVGAADGAVFSAVSLVSVWFSSALQKCCQSRRTGCTARGCRYAKCEILCYQKVKTGFHCGCYEDIVLFVLLLAPAAPCCRPGFPNTHVLMK